MANPKHLAALMRGGKAWNEWRKECSLERPDLTNIKLMGRVGEEPANGDLSSADLSGADLRGATLWSLNIHNAKFVNADARNADFRTSNVRGADFSMADLRFAALNGAELERATFRSANMQDAKLYQANCSEADFTGANLRNAYLSGALFHATVLNGVDITGAMVGRTVFAEVDLRTATGLETLVHRSPSTVGVDTLYFSGGAFPRSFLRGAGVPDGFITYAGSLVGKPIEFYSCFVSHSSKDQQFADRLHADLQVKGVRCWFAPEDLKIGDKFRDRIDESIRLHDKLLIVLSEQSIASAWVRREVEAAFEREDRQKTIVLFPIRVDDAVIQTNEAWAADIRRTRHIGDFTRWKDHDAYRRAFERLLRDLKAEAPKW